MHPVRHRHILRKVSAYGTLAASIALVAVSLSQCRMVGVDDSVEGIGFASREAGQCIADCNHAYNDSIRAESERHVDAVHACNHSASCLNGEEARHVAAVHRIQDGRHNCHENCHHQGGGGGGR